MIYQIGSFLEFLHLNFRINDLIDIALFACFVYYVIKYFMAKPQRPILTFSAFVGFLYFISKVFHLILISEILKLLFTVILILIAIVFQRDIRRFIEQISSKFSRLNESELPLRDDKEKICQIIKNLAEKKIGAILVFVGNAPVTNIITGGKAICARFESDLVESIFDARTPGHDGAMIIENGSITRMSCQLPLSKGAKLSLNLGTRHSAALGLSERSDCLTFVISEERGTVSIAENSRLIYEISDKFVELKLTHYLKAKKRNKKHKKRFLDYFRSNIPLKVFSSLIAILAWTLSIYEPGISYTSFMMPVEVRNLHSDLVIKGMSNDLVKVTLSGPSSYVTQLKRKTQKILIDFQEAKDGETIFQSHDFKLDFPKNITIHGYQPNSITAILSAYKEEEIPVVLKTIGELDPNLVISKIEISPRGKKISIPIQVDTKQLTLSTSSVDLGKLSKENFSIKIKIDLPEKVKLKNNESDFVKVDFHLKEKVL